MRRVSTKRHVAAALTRVTRGQATVELALVVPILAMLAFGALDLGRIFSTQIALTNAAREGARFCARFPAPPNDPLPRITEEMIPWQSALTTSPAPVCVLDSSTDVATVSVQATFSPITPLIGSLAGSQITLSATASMPVG